MEVIQEAIEAYAEEDDGAYWLKLHHPLAWTYSINYKNPKMKKTVNSTKNQVIFNFLRKVRLWLNLLNKLFETSYSMIIARMLVTRVGLEPTRTIQIV